MTNNKIKFLSIGTLILIIGAFVVLYLYKDNKVEVLTNEFKQIGDISLPSPLRGPISDVSSTGLNSEEIIALTNVERVNDGQSALVENKFLDEAASNKADDMFNNQYFEHVSPIDNKDVTYFVLEENYQYAYVGENLALGNFKNDQEMVQAWMDSEGHRENILNRDYTEIGVAVKKGLFEGRETWIGVQIFAKSAPNCMMPDQSLSQSIEEFELQYKIVYEYEKDIDVLRQESQSLITEGNNMVLQGNKIYEETGDTSLAQTYWTQGKDKYDLGVRKNDEANQLVEKINNLNIEYESIQLKIKEYNKQIDQYNECIKK